MNKIRVSRARNGRCSPRHGARHHNWTVTDEIGRRFVYANFPAAIFAADRMSTSIIGISDVGLVGVQLPGGFQYA